VFEIYQKYNLTQSRFAISFAERAEGIE